VTALVVFKIQHYFKVPTKAHTSSLGNTTQNDPIQQAEIPNSSTMICHLDRSEIPRDFHPFFDL
jgi:hypothetical protein